MTPATASTTPMSQRPNWFARTEMWLDERGKAAWITLMVLSFIFFWPVGLLVLGYMIMNNKFAGGGCGRRMRRASHAMSSTGNAAFDAYKADTLRRLEEEQENFEAFLKRLRDAKDKAEFDQFMEERARPSKSDDDA